MYQEAKIIRYAQNEAPDWQNTFAPLIQEEKLTLYLNGQKLNETYCSPSFIQELAVGYLASQGLLFCQADLLDYQENEQQVQIKTAAPRLEPDQHLSLQFDLPHILNLIEELNQKSQIFKLTGGVHSAGLMLESKLAACYEDISRHNAVNKVLGHLLLKQLNPQKSALLVTSRVSLEMIQQIIPLRIPLLVSRSAPSEAAVKLAEQAQITLVGFARGNKCNIYTHPQRLQASPPAPLLFFHGFSNSGKTTVIEKLIQELKQRGIKTAAIKHASHGYQRDIPGKDSSRFYQAGAAQVLVAGQEGFSLHQACSAPPQLRDLLPLLQKVDLILVEGFKEEAGLKIAVRPLKHLPPRLHTSEKISKAIPEECIALVGDEPEMGLPWFNREDITGLANFILTYFHLAD
ncbi:MAG: molybdopterin-guanine dinucleotide biosynthesis protein B [Clostridia bacterium]|nr:molybdopterin-guanine dinucleotide biosynthesis protein B [Clostridia bacterium]